MILKVLLKYKIFEYCLDTLFENVNSNFSICKIITPKKGDHFVNIIHSTGKKNFTYIYCTIIDCYRMSNIDDYLITFDYLSIKYDDSKIISGHAISAYYLSSLDFVK